MAPRDAQAGFTLVEALVALSLFALIGLAGFGVLEGVLRARSQTDARLEAMAALDRAGHLMTLDFEQLADGVFVQEGARLTLRRLAAEEPDGALLVRYDLDGEVLRRTLGGLLTADRREQALASGIEALRWGFLDPSLGWVDLWPPESAAPGALPLAVAAEFTMAPGRPGPAGSVRRVFRITGASP